MGNTSSIGDVAVIKGEPENNNPYRGLSVSGDERVEALRAFRDGHPADDYTFWHAPTSGGARRLHGPEEVDWNGMR